MSGFADPPQPAQPGGTISEAVDLRPTDAVWQGNRLVYVSTYPCGVGPRDCVRVTELNTTGANSVKEPSLTQDFLVAENGEDLYMGGIGLTGNGTLHVGWTRSSVSGGDSRLSPHLPAAIPPAPSPLRMRGSPHRALPGSRPHES